MWILFIFHTFFSIANQPFTSLWPIHPPFFPDSAVTTLWLCTTGAKKKFTKKNAVSWATRPNRATF